MMMTPRSFKGFLQIFDAKDAQLLLEDGLLYATFLEAERPPRLFSQLYGTCDELPRSVGWAHKTFPKDTFYIKLEE